MSTPDTRGRSIEDGPDRRLNSSAKNLRRSARSVSRRRPNYSIPDMMNAFGIPGIPSPPRIPKKKKKRNRRLSQKERDGAEYRPKAHELRRRSTALTLPGGDRPVNNRRSRNALGRSKINYRDGQIGSDVDNPITVEDDPDDAAGGSDTIHVAVGERSSKAAPLRPTNDGEQTPSKRREPAFTSAAESQIHPYFRKAPWHPSNDGLKTPSQRREPASRPTAEPLTPSTTAPLTYSYFPQAQERPSSDKGKAPIRRREPASPSTATPLTHSYFRQSQERPSTSDRHSDTRRIAIDALLKHEKRKRAQIESDADSDGYYLSPQPLSKRQRRASDMQINQGNFGEDDADTRIEGDVQFSVEQDGDSHESSSHDGNDSLTRGSSPVPTLSTPSSSRKPPHSTVASSATSSGPSNKGEIKNTNKTGTVTSSDNDALGVTDNNLQSQAFAVLPNPSSETALRMNLLEQPMIIQKVNELFATFAEVTTNAPPEPPEYGLRHEATKPPIDWNHELITSVAKNVVDRVLCRPKFGSDVLRSASKRPQATQTLQKQQLSPPSSAQTEPDENRQLISELASMPYVHSLTKTFLKDLVQALHEKVLGKYETLRKE